ncbi:unnamed protein product [Thlaspi arvense]|uniref:Uncharacterized protein n=1 Tax=Thlaspi arvense TaxID=13288 RepID=A0AAU9SXP2_THLAR|nr:unnamed protein product [Thlaspi arvense]
MSSIGARYASLHIMQEKLKEELKEKTKREKKREEKAQNLAVETSFATGRISNKIYPSHLSYNDEQVTTKSQE